jgi:thiosulfate dehydrogenase
MRWFIIILGAYFMAMAIIVMVVLANQEEKTVVPIQANNWLTDPTQVKEPVWKGPETNQIPSNDLGDLIKYGRELISNTSKYLGPKGSIGHYSNGMNCQNCHLDAGTRAWGNNYFAVYSTYPKFRERSGSIETIPKRVNDCFERSLNGRALDTNSREMAAIVKYIQWLSTGVPKGVKPEGSGIKDLAFLMRSANKENGKSVYVAKCQSCHQPNGEGLMKGDESGYEYPPLWGDNSYNNGAGLFRLSRFAGFVKYNMPLGATHEKPQLSNEEAWDVAAFVNSMPRPKKDISKDWPNIAGKPLDHPFGPYDDGFTEEQHKFGPFEPIKKAREEKRTNKSYQVKL